MFDAEEIRKEIVELEIMKNSSTDGNPAFGRLSRVIELKIKFNLMESIDTRKKPFKVMCVG